MSGIKRHIAVDTQGLPHAIAITTAKMTDRKSALAAFTLYKPFLPKIINVLANSVYVGQSFVDAARELLGASVEITKRNELHTFVLMLKWWAVERSFVWLEKCRRCKRKLNTNLQFAVWAFLSLLLRRS